MKLYWKADFVGNPFLEVQAKMKSVRKALAVWSREAYGDIFQKVATLEDSIRVKDTQFELQPFQENREELKKMEAEFKMFLKAEEEFWQQKAGMKWLQDGDRNTRFFHTYLKGKRRRLHIREIMNS